MAKTKKSASTKAPKKTAKTKTKSSKSSSSAKTEGARPSKGSWQEDLLALPVSYEDKINRSVGDVLYDASNLRRTALKEWNTLSKKTLLASDALEQLKQRAEHLESAEAAWTDARKLRAPAKLVKAREQGRSLRSDAVAALRYFLRQDDEVQAQVDNIVEGDGDADLIDDLRKLATLVDEHSDALAKAELPKDGSDAFRKLAELLTDETSERASDVAGAKALALRNRAYWSLRELMSEVRAAGRYVFRKEPLTAAKFVDPLGNKSATKEAAPAPDADKAGH